MNHWKLMKYTEIIMEESGGLHKHGCLPPRNGLDEKRLYSPCLNVKGVYAE